MPILKDRVTQLEFNIQKMQEELSYLRDEQKKEEKEKKPSCYKFTPTYMRRRSAM